MVFSCVSASWRSIHRQKIAVDCRRTRRSREAVSNSSNHPNLGDLDQIARAYPVVREFYLLLLTALSTRARMLQFESLGSISRVKLTGKDSVEELAPLRIATEMLVRWIIPGRAVDTATTIKKADSRPLHIDLGESEVRLSALTSESEHGRTLSLHFSASEPLAEEATSLLRDYQRFFVGDPWMPEQPIRLPMKRAANAIDPPSTMLAVQAENEGDSVLHLVYRSRFILGDSPLWATVDGVCVAHGSLRKGFDQVLSISTGNHLLQIGAYCHLGLRNCLLGLEQKRAGVRPGRDGFSASRSLVCIKSASALSTWRPATGERYQCSNTLVRDL